MWSRGSLSFAVVVALAATAARADIAPDDGTRFVEYGFRVDNVEAFPEFVVLAYPWSLSNGAPTVEHVEIKPGEVVGVGRRSGAPELYAMRRADFEAWTASHPEGAPNSEPDRVALFASDRVKKCGVQVSPQHSARADYQGSIIDVFRAESIDASGCKISAVPEKSVYPPATAAPAKPVTPPPQSPAAGCRVTGEAPGLAMLVLLGLRRRRVA